MGLFDTIKGAVKGAKEKYDEYQAKAPEREKKALEKRKKEIETLKYETQKANLTHQKLKAESKVREMRQERFKNLTMSFGSGQMLGSGQKTTIGQPLMSMSYKGYKKRKY